MTEAHLRTLFQHMLEGYAHCRLLFENGRPSDFVYLDVNEAFERVTGLANLIGRRVSEVIPGIHTSNPEVLETYARVVARGEPESFEAHVATLNGWFAITCYRHGTDEFVAVVDDVTVRKQAVQALAESEDRYRAVPELSGFPRSQDVLEPSSTMDRRVHDRVEVRAQARSIHPWCTLRGIGDHRARNEAARRNRSQLGDGNSVRLWGAERIRGELLKVGVRDRGRE